MGRRVPIQPGEPAPDFTLPALHREGVVSLADYRGTRPVLVALFRGLYCAFCRRHIAHLGLTAEQLQAVGVETLGIVATTPERGRLYLQFHPMRSPLAADPERVTHQSFGLPQVKFTPRVALTLALTKGDPTGEFGKPQWLLFQPFELARRDGFKMTAQDKADERQHGGQTIGQFLVDRDGIVRWANIEGAQEGPAGLGKFPSTEELVAAARAL
jgi:peroxiredoxin